MLAQKKILSFLKKNKGKYFTAKQIQENVSPILDDYSHKNIREILEGPNRPIHINIDRSKTYPSYSYSRKKVRLFNWNLKNPKKENWIINSAIAGLSSMVLTSILLALPFGWWSISILSGLFVFIFVLLRNPEYFYRRMISYALGALIGFISLPAIEAQGLITKNSFVKILSQNNETTIYIILTVLIISLIIADIVTRRGR